MKNYALLCLLCLCDVLTQLAKKTMHDILQH